MSDELFDGNVASEMTLGEAIVRGILNPPKYVLSVFSYQKDLERYQRRVYNAQSRIVRDTAERYLEALRCALEKADGLDVIFQKHIEDRNGKYIVFCANKEHMDEMIDHVPEWFGNIDAFPNVYTAYSSDPETSRAFADFKADDSEHLKLLFCIDMLNEGIHVDEVSGVILFRPTVSPIVYKQQIGRAMSASKKKNAVIFDIVNNISNLYSIGSIQEEITEAVEYFRMNGDGEEIVNETFTVIDEVRDCIRLFDELENVLVASWEYMYLEAIGMDWQRFDGKWMLGFTHFEEYIQTFGNMDISSTYVAPDGFRLGQWVFAQRNRKMLGKLSDDKIEKLESFGFVWSVTDAAWDNAFSALREYKEKHGGLNVPADYTTPQGVKLRGWINNQRTKFKKGKLTEYQMLVSTVSVLVGRHKRIIGRQCLRVPKSITKLTAI